MAILTISREYGSGGREIGRGIAEQLGYGYEDRARCWHRCAQPTRAGSASATSTTSTRPRSGSASTGPSGYAALLQRHLLEAAAGDRVVIVGRGGALLLAGVPTALHVRIVAPLAARIERIMRREHADHDT